MLDLDLVDFRSRAAMAECQHCRVSKILLELALSSKKAFSNKNRDDVWTCKLVLSFMQKNCAT